MAEGYGTNEGADAYHAARGNTVWATKTAEAKTAARLRTSEWMDATYRHQFPGYKVNRRDQEREWPRFDATDSDGNPLPYDEVPIEVEHAAYEGSLREIVTPGTLVPDVVGVSALKRIKAGSVELEYSGVPQSNATYDIIGLILSNVLKFSSTHSMYSSAAIRA